MLALCCTVRPHMEEVKTAQLTYFFLFSGTFLRNLLTILPCFSLQIIRNPKKPRKTQFYSPPFWDFCQWRWTLKTVEKVHFSLKWRRKTFFDVFWTEKSVFLNIWTHLYRRIFWRGIQKWPYFLHFMGKKRPKSRKNVKMAFLKGFSTKNAFFPL